MSLGRSNSWGNSWGGGAVRIPGVVEASLPQSISGDSYISREDWESEYMPKGCFLQRYLSWRLLMPIEILKGCRYGKN